MISLLSSQNPKEILQKGGCSGNVDVLFYSMELETIFQIRKDEDPRLNKGRRQLLIPSWSSRF